MTTTVFRHGVSIGMERVNETVFLSIKAIGKLTHDDYEMITPVIESALDGIKDPKVKVFFDATELEGWKLRAAWDDLKLGLKYGNEFDKIAVVGNKKWLEIGTKVAGWFTSGETRFFETSDDALDWLQE